MIRIDLVAQEAAMLLDVLESYLSDLRMEIADTDSMEMRETLKAKEIFLKKLIGRLREA
ncbi:MAG TPA: hypothetical protein VFT43_04625 [Candidatus Polarisedimenticolia bacterium]|nr:hypothetical protein [Candidatus Polarisedimenticolia bacterium]